MATTIIVAAVACALVYFMRCNFRRAWYVLRTGDEHPDWDALDAKYGAEYFEAGWERWIKRRFGSRGGSTKKR